MSLVVIMSAVLDEARVLFEDRGAHGCEGTAMVMAGPDGVAHRLVVPDQRATPAPYCSVEVTTQGKFELPLLGAAAGQAGGRNGCRRYEPSSRPWNDTRQLGGPAAR
jgi:hypothetical protein